MSKRQRRLDHVAIRGREFHMYSIDWAESSVDDARNTGPKEARSDPQDLSMVVAVTSHTNGRQKHYWYTGSCNKQGASNNNIMPVTKTLINGVNDARSVGLGGRNDVIIQEEVEHGESKTAFSFGRLQIYIEIY